MTLGSHQRTIGATQVHLTLKWIIDALELFDLDPCAALSWYFRQHSPKGEDPSMAWRMAQSALRSL
jgi:hypothetical protein